MTYANQSRLPVIDRFAGTPTHAELESLALQLRRDIVEITWYSGTGSSHVGGELSMADILAVLFGSILRLDPRNPKWPERDRFILSKGHASAALYAAMAWLGALDRAALWNEFNRVGGRLEEHANLELAGVEAATGSLGMGLSNACGMAWSGKLLHQHDPWRTFVLLSDGECTEGQTWEAAMFAARRKLDNLVAIVDFNRYMVSSQTAELLDEQQLAASWNALGWEVQMVDGHNIAALRSCLERAADRNRAPGTPRLVIARTVKGYPISFMQSNPASWHAGHLTSELYHEALRELGAEQ